MLASYGDLVVMYNKTYLSNNILQILLLQYIHDVTLQHTYSINRGCMNMKKGM